MNPKKTIITDTAKEYIGENHFTKTAFEMARFLKIIHYHHYNY